MPILGESGTRAYPNSSMWLQSARPFFPRVRQNQKSAPQYLHPSSNGSPKIQAQIYYHLIDLLHDGFVLADMDLDICNFHMKSPGWIKKN